MTRVTKAHYVIIIMMNRTQTSADQKPKFENQGLRGCIAHLAEGGRSGLNWEALQRDGEDTSCSVVRYHWATVPRGDYLLRWLRKSFSYSTVLLVLAWKTSCMGGGSFGRWSVPNLLTATATLQHRLQSIMRHVGPAFQSPLILCRHRPPHYCNKRESR